MILVQGRQERKKKPKDVLSIVQKIKQEDAVGAISPKSPTQHLVTQTWSR